VPAGEHDGGVPRRVDVGDRGRRAELRGDLLEVGAMLPGSTVGVTPPGVAIVTEWPAATRSRCAVTSSSAQKPVGCGVPSARVSVSAPVTIMRMSLMVILSSCVVALAVVEVWV
jgi:hypothetical protein